MKINSFNQGKDAVAALCQHFRTNRSMFLAPNAKEAHIRQMLIDPMFEALGWDVCNRARLAPQYREVVPEDSLDVDGRQRAPDYTFRVGSQPRFYAEAKKCGINLNADPGPAHQLRRYGWSAKVPVSLLTDFEELAVYDCTLRPRPSDRASRGRITYLGWEQYPDRWREIWDLFSREAVWSGAFDEYAASQRKRGTSEVDVEFLKEIEGWREALARNIALRNKDLSSDDLNAAVQRTIDRVVFLRMAEDRGLEPYEQLLSLCDRPNIYARFMSELCRKADEKYNSGIFHFHREAGVAEPPDSISPKLVIDDKVFRDILRSLYFAHGSPYDFGVMPVEILGTVYERFLGKVIRLTPSHQARIEEKPEVRKAGGVYYTPSYIVDYIVGQTVGRHIEGKSPAQLAGGKSRPTLRVLDMACGSGSFLLGAYQRLLDHCTKWYLEHSPENHPRAVYKDARTEAWRLTIEEKKRILTTHLYGVDIDRQAVEVTKLSLLLKALEGEDEATLAQQLELFRERALPNLADNIQCGNSLIGPDYFAGALLPEAEEIRRVNPFDWRYAFPAAMQEGGFDCIIGNPPYLFITEVPQEHRSYYQKRYSCATYRYDLYGAFIQRALEGVLSTGGRLGLIIPHTLLSNDSFAALRSLLAQETQILQVVDLGPGVFQEARNETMLLFVRQEPPSDSWQTEVISTTAKDVGRTLEGAMVKQKEWAAHDGMPWLVLAPSASGALLRRMDLHPRRLADFCTANQGLRTGDNKRFLSCTKHDDRWFPAAGGRDVSRYAPLRGGTFVLYDRDQLDAPRRPEIFTAPSKIVVQEIRNISLPRRVVATLDTEQILCLQSTNVVNLRPGASVDLLYILGALNSNAVNHYFRCAFPGNNHIPSNQLLRLPIPLPPDRAAHDRVVELVTAMLTLHRRLAEANSEVDRAILERQIAVTDAEIDRLVYQLYGLTDEEIAVIKSGE